MNTEAVFSSDVKYVSGHQCPIAEYGYSRTHRPDLEQVELGLLVTPEGLPITHEVFAGNTPDKKTVKEILERLKEEFSVEQCVFVGDRGMVTHKNTVLLAELNYPYIVGYHKRGRVVSDALLEQYNDVSGYTVLRENLSYLEVPVANVDDDEKDKDTRYILCHNPIKATADEGISYFSTRRSRAGFAGATEPVGNAPPWTKAEYPVGDAQGQRDSDQEGCESLLRCGIRWTEDHLHPERGRTGQGSVP